MPLQLSDGHPSVYRSCKDCSSKPQLTGAASQQSQLACWASSEGWPYA